MTGDDGGLTVKSHTTYAKQSSGSDGGPCFRVEARSADE
jgi:hypothetical protein